MSSTGGSAWLRGQVERRARLVDQAITEALRITLKQGGPVTVVAIARRAGVSPITVSRRDDVMAKVEDALNSNAPVELLTSETPLPEEDRRTHARRVLESLIGHGSESTDQPAESDGRS